MRNVANTRLFIRKGCEKFSLLSNNIVINHSNNTHYFLFVYFLQKLRRKGLPLIHQKSSLIS